MPCFHLCPQVFFSLVSNLVVPLNLNKLSIPFLFQGGNGTYYYTDGRLYKGGWKDGKQSGSGSLTWPDGDSYVGAWEDGVRQGWGAYYWNNGNSYQVLIYGWCVDSLARGHYF